MQWRKHVRIKYGGRVGVGQGQREREQVQLQVRVVQLQREGGARLSYVCHQPQLSSTARRSCSAAAMLCCGRRKVSRMYACAEMSLFAHRHVQHVLGVLRHATKGRKASRRRVAQMIEDPRIPKSKWPAI